MSRFSVRAIKRRFKSFSMIGPRCPEYASGCGTCESYRYYYRFGRFPSNAEEFFAFQAGAEEGMVMSWRALKKSLAPAD